MDQENDKAKMLELTQEEQNAADHDAAILEAVLKMNPPNKLSIQELFPNAIAISNLVAAASGGKLHRVKLALKEGEDVNSPCVMFGSPLHAAASQGHLEIVKFLVDYGADVQARDLDGKTAAEVASKPEIAEFLHSAK